PPSVNQTLPSAPVVIPVGPRSAMKPGVAPPTKRVTTPAVVMRPMAPGLTGSVNHSAPSGRLVLWSGWVHGTANSVTTAGGRVLAAIGHDGHLAGGRELRDPPRAGGLGEPQIAVRACGDPGRERPRPQVARILGDRTAGSDLHDSALGGEVPEPEISVGTTG